MTSKGQITLPAELRRRWRLKAGDRIDFTLEGDERVVMTPRARRSILTSRQDLPPLSLGRPLTQGDVDDAVASAFIVPFIDEAVAATGHYRKGPADFADYLFSEINRSLGCTTTVAFDRKAAKDDLFTLSTV